MKKGQRVKVEFEGIVEDLLDYDLVKVGKVTPESGLIHLVHESQCTVLPDPEPDVALADGKVWLRVVNGYYWCGDSAYDSYNWQELVDEFGAEPAKAVRLF